MCAEIAGKLPVRWSYPAISRFSGELSDPSGFHGGRF